jgi:hypothetical protein
MTIDQFLYTTSERLPTANEIVSLCQELKIQFAMSGGRPVIRPSVQNRMMALLIAKLISREPWRSQVIDLAELKAEPCDLRSAASKQPEIKCECGSTAHIEVPIHGGNSRRRDCAICGRFISFPIWHGKTKDL